MNLNATPQGERVHIGIFGNTNAGKSSVINAMTNQQISIVSTIRGTTTDPVHKAMELLPLGPVVIFDTPGLDDETELGKERVKRANDILKKTDIAVLVTDASEPPDKHEIILLDNVKQSELPVVIALNKSDQGTKRFSDWEPVAKQYNADLVTLSALTKDGIEEFKNILSLLKPNQNKKTLIRDLVNENETCVLVIPIDSAAPKGRLILPQQQIIRDLLDGGAKALVTRNNEYEDALNSLKDKPTLVVTDSQVFGEISKKTPDDIPLTSFSILFARYKGDLQTLAHGANAVDSLQDGDNVLICEGCTHHRQCDDIGTVKIPKWLKGHNGKQTELNFTFTSGTGFPKDLSPYKVIVHCGGCMLNEREMDYRIQSARQANIPIVNYGVLIAHINGILSRCIEPFKTLGSAQTRKLF